MTSLRRSCTERLPGCSTNLVTIRHESGRVQYVFREEGEFMFDPLPAKTSNPPHHIMKYDTSII
jgi:hypothetical protein